MTDATTLEFAGLRRSSRLSPGWFVPVAWRMHRRSSEIVVVILQLQPGIAAVA